MKLAIAILFLYSVATAYGEETKTRIANYGEVASEGEFPYQVSIKVNDHHFCGGSLISKKHVLTAAHCVKKAIDMGYFPGPVTVEVGSTRLGAGKSYKAKRISYLSGFTFESAKFLPNDISVVHLTEPVETSDKVAVISLPQPDTSLPVGSEVIASGFGTDDARFGRNSPVLKKMDAKIVSHAQCQQPRMPLLHLGKICAAKGPGYGTCTGDSGGPLVDQTKKTLIGVVSGGDGECSKGTADVYTEVSRFMPYINEELNWKPGSASKNPAIDLEKQTGGKPFRPPTQLPQFPGAWPWPPQYPTNPLQPYPQQPQNPMNPWDPWRPHPQQPQQPLNPWYPHLQQPFIPPQLYPQQPLNPHNPYPQKPMYPLYPSHPQNPFEPQPQKPLDPSDPDMEESVSA